VAAGSLTTAVQPYVRPSQGGWNGEMSSLLPAVRAAKDTHRLDGASEHEGGSSGNVKPNRPREAAARAQFGPSFLKFRPQTTVETAASGPLAK
jgi:hypothetical protein